MNSEPEPKATSGKTTGVAAKIVSEARLYRILLTASVFVLALLLIFYGSRTMLREVEQASTRQTAVQGKAAVEVSIGPNQLIAKNLTSGGVLCVCGTVIICTLILKRSRARTQHSSGGFTEVES